MTAHPAAYAVHYSHGPYVTSSKYQSINRNTIDSARLQFALHLLEHKKH